MFLPSIFQYIQNAQGIYGSQLVEKHGILPNGKLAEKAIPKANIVFLDGEKSKSPMNAFLEVLYELNPASVGGKLPDEAFYYTK
jgi:NitT/TauT family transport system substrate-binding protein